MRDKLRCILRHADDRSTTSLGVAGKPMIDHFNLPVSDLADSRRFYERVLAPLGFRSLLQTGDAVGFGVDTWAFGIVVTARPFPKPQIAFRAKSRDAVDDFFRAATDAGAQPNGSPGIRAAYDPAYYAAFVIDPDGHNTEAVCRSEGDA